MTGLMLIGSLALAAEPVPLLEAEDLCYGTLPDSTGCEVLLTLQDPLSDEELATACEDLDNLVVSCVDQLGETDTCWRIDDVLLDTCGGVDTHASWWRGDDDDDDGGGDWWRDDDDDDGGRHW